MNHYHEWRVCWQMNLISFGGLATFSTVNNLPEKIDEKMFTLHLKHRPWKTYNNSYSLWGNNCYCASVNVNPLKAFYIASQNDEIMGFDKKLLCKQLLWENWGWEIWERELESTFYNHIDAKIRINSLAPPLVLQLLLSKRSLLLPAATSALLLTQRTPQKIMH